MKKTLLLSLALIFTLSVSAKSPKYVFLFIGDGMGPAQVEMTRAALSDLSKGADRVGFTPLSFSNFPVHSTSTTHSATRLITDSAAAGTALASGEKTSPGTIGMDTHHTKNITSVAEKAHKKGIKVAILSTVSIDHATPASFYAHQKSRNQYKEIADWLPQSNFELLAGSGLIKISKNYYDSIAEHTGYKVVKGNNAEFKTTDKVVWIQDEGANAASLPYAIDRKENDMTLPIMVKKAIEHIDNKDGFFIMAEGGMIDWAAHGNDAATIAMEVIDFSESIKEAVKFYEEHPNETLIVVTADHETGGLTIGRGDRGYDTDLHKLFEQKGSKEKVGSKRTLEVNKLAGVGFTSGSHTAIPVPVYAIGAGAEEFAKPLDNTDIPNIIMELLGL